MSLTKRVMKIPNRIYEYRTRKGLTQLELAKLVDVSRAHLGKVERGDTKASRKLLSRIAKELDCSVNEIYTPGE